MRSHEYLAIMLTTTGSPPWQHEFVADNDAEAAAYMERILRTDFPGIRWLLKIGIWSKSTEDMQMVTFSYERWVINLRPGTLSCIFERTRT